MTGVYPESGAVPPEAQLGYGQVARRVFGAILLTVSGFVVERRIDAAIDQEQESAAADDNAVSPDGGIMAYAEIIERESTAQREAAELDKLTKYKDDANARQFFLSIQWIAAVTEQENRRVSGAVSVPAEHVHASLTSDEEFLSCTRAHESDSAGGYRAISPDGAYRGAYQFLQSTWDSTARQAGRSDLVGVAPDQASPGDQDMLALFLYHQQGNRPWNGRC